jgi:hypothetical protein
MKAVASRERFFSTIHHSEETDLSNGGRIRATYRATYLIDETGIFHER